MSRVRSPSLTPAVSSNRRAPVAQLDRASDSGSEGLRFESGRAHHRFFVGGVNGASDGFARARASLARSLHVGTASASAQSISCHSGSCRPARGVRFRQHALGAQRSFQPDADGGSPGDRRDAAPAGDARTRKHPDPGGHSVHDVHARCRRGLHARYVSDSFGYPDGGLDVHARHADAVRRHAHRDAVHGSSDTHGPVDADPASVLPAHTHLPADARASAHAHAPTHADAVLSPASSGISICAMPRPPGRSLTAAALRGSPYSSLLARMAAHRGEIFPLHVGDTWRQAPEGGRPEELPRGIPGINRYTDIKGLPELRDAIVERMRSRTGASLARANVLVTGGATAGLMAAVGALVSPGEEVLLLAPRWPLIEGHVRMAGARPGEA